MEAQFPKPAERGSRQYSGTYSELPEDEEVNDVGVLPKEGGGVQFKSPSSIEDVMHISRASNYNMEETTNYWGGRHDVVVRKSELKEAVRDMYFNRRSSDSEFTTLGIADKVGTGKLIKKTNRQLGWSAVMDEQDLQHHEGIANDELMADVYAISSDSAKREAQTKAARLHSELAKGNK